MDKLTRTEHIKKLPRVRLLELRARLRYQLQSRPVYELQIIRGQLDIIDDQLRDLLQHKLDFDAIQTQWLPDQEETWQEKKADWSTEAGD